MEPNETTTPALEPTPSAPEPPSPPLAPSPLDEAARLSTKLKLTGDLLIHAAASRMIRLGRENPRLREAGYWLYGNATRLVPRGREVGKLGMVGEGVYRGAQPSAQAFATLVDLGVETVINLRPESDHERDLVSELGLNYIYLPLPPLDAPTHEVTIEFLRQVTDPANGSVFFHCFHGVDRTGTMAACLRIARDGWNVEDALAEMRAYKLHEKGQRAKVGYLQAFADHWNAQSEGFRCEVLHRPLPIEVAPEPEAPAPWWRRALAWLGGRWPRQRP